MESHVEVDWSATRAARLRSRVVGVVLAIVAPLVVWAAASLAGASLEVSSPLVGTLQISAILIISSTLPLALAAWGVLAILERFARRPRTVWTAIAIAVLVLSVLPVPVLEASVGTKVALGLMHLVTGLVLILMFRRSALRAR